MKKFNIANKLVFEVKIIIHMQINFSTQKINMNKSRPNYSY